MFGLSVSLFVTRAPRGRVVGRFVCLFVCQFVCVSTVFLPVQSSQVFSSLHLVQERWVW